MWHDIGTEDERRLGPIFKQINIRCMKAFNKKMEKHNLTFPQSEILLFLGCMDGQPVSQRQIEMHLHLKNPTVTGLLKRLEEKNYVSRTINPKDKRSHMVVLTKESQELLSVMRQEGEEMDQKLIEGLSEKEIEQLFCYLNVILNNIPK
ncbi:MAG: MarR family transcriptional regulator [Lachnospiraceae bacterium]|nr:MarR family transcriptional regulator [Lachnospiraceae bacterium]